jgi:hypothetical protein
MLCADRVRNKNAHFRSSALTQAGSPDSRNDRICIIYLLAALMPPAVVSAPYISRPGLMAQAIRAILSASATYWHRSYFWCLFLG